jgi:CheY-like chemotaxis protein
MLGVLMESFGHEVLIEHDAHRALERARAIRPEVCILDIGLPGMDGYELARQLGHDPRTAGATLIAVTGYGQERNRHEGQAAGFSHYFVKPVDSAELAQALAAIQNAAPPGGIEPGGCP